jgi:hypothetical protein
MTMAMHTETKVWRRKVRTCSAYKCHKTCDETDENTVGRGETDILLAVGRLDGEKNSHDSPFVRWAVGSLEDEEF